MKKILMWGSLLAGAVATVLAWRWYNLPENRFERAARFVREAYESNRTDEFPRDPYVSFSCLCEDAERGKVSAMAALYARLDPFPEAGAEKLLAELRAKADGGDAEAALETAQCYGDSASMYPLSERTAGKVYYFLLAADLYEPKEPVSVLEAHRVYGMAIESLVYCENGYDYAAEYIEKYRRLLESRPEVTDPSSVAAYYLQRLREKEDLLRRIRREGQSALPNFRDPQPWEAF